jgi:geranylgeranylglycerol-phosphate geranylgeranyltransferase
MSTSRLRSFIVLVTPQYGILVLFNVLSASLIVARGSLPLGPAALLAVSFLAGIFFLNALNQIADLELDRINKPRRPLPSGRISLGEAKLVTIVLFAGGLCTSALIGRGNFLAMLIFLLISVEYSYPPIVFRRSWLGASFVGALLLGAMPVIAMSLALHRSIDVPSALLFAGLIWALTMTKDLEDAAGDKVFGHRTIPVLFGKTFALNLVVLEILALLLTVFVCSCLGICFGRLHVYSSAACVPLVILWRRYAARADETDIVTQSRVVTSGMFLIGAIQLIHALAEAF